MLPGIQGIAGAGHRSVSKSYTGMATNTSNLTTYTFSNASLGVASVDRYIVVAVVDAVVILFGSQVPPAVNSVTVAGNSCTKVADAVSAGFVGVPRVTLWITNAPVTTGTTGDIVVTLASAATGAAVAAWAIYGIASPVPHTSGTDTGYGPLSINLNHPANGVLISAAGFAKDDSGTATWTGAVEDFEGDNGSGYEFTGASKANLDQSTAQNVQVSHSLDTDPADTWHAMVAATWS